MDVWKLVATMPSTNVRIGATILMALLTAGRVAFLGRSPPVEWLGFLVVWAGLDVGQFIGKRTTDANYMAVKKNGSTTAEMRAATSQGGR